MSLLCGGKKAKKRQKRDPSPSYGKTAEDKDEIRVLQTRVRDLENEKGQLEEEKKQERKAKDAALQENAKLKKQIELKSPGDIDVVVKSNSQQLAATEPVNINRHEVDKSEIKQHQDRIKELENEKIRLEEDLKMERKAKMELQEEHVSLKIPSNDAAKSTGESGIEIKLNNANRELEAEKNLRKAIESEKVSLLAQLQATKETEEKQTQATEEIRKLQKELEQMKNLLEAERKNLTKALAEKDKYKKDKDSFEQTLNITKKELDLARKESHIPRSPTRAPSDEWKSKIDNAEAELKKERELRLEKERETTRLTSEKELLLQEKDELQKKLKNEQSRNAEELAKQKNLEMNFKNNEKRLEDTIEDYKRQLNESGSVKESLMTRLSAVTGSQVLDNNPNITDLSDHNQPQKLAEEMSELYNNQWTDASDGLEKIRKTDQERIKLLLDLLIEVYKHCKEAAENQLSRIEENIVLPPLDSVPPNFPDANGTDQLKSPTSSKQSMSKIPRFTSHKGRPALPNISSEKKTADECQKDKLKNTLSLSKITGEKLPDIPLEIRKGIKEYRKKVTKQVWPVIEKEVMNKFRKNEVFDDTVLDICKDYIAKCVELCWLMRVQDPPMVLSWSIPDDNTFQDQFYRAHTKTGKHVEYVVWPTLYQGDNGPIVMKGVAQCVYP